MSTREQPAADGYVLGHSQNELARLERQARFFADMTREILVRAGLKPGMRVLDLGCGVGDVTLIAAAIVGPAGAVTGIDIAPAAVNIAAARAEAGGIGNVGFRVATIEGFDGYGQFDAVIGRFIMVHLPDPGKTLRRIAGQLRDGGIVAFCEMDMSTAKAVPAAPLIEENLNRIAEVYRRAGLDPDPGTRLFRTLREARLEPLLYAMTRIGDRDDLAGFEFLAESVKSLIPMLVKLQIATAAEVGIETLRDRLMAEAQQIDPCVFYPRFVGGWAVKG